MPSKMRPIGWIIEVRKTKRHKWRNLYTRDYFKSQKGAMQMFKHFNTGDSFSVQAPAGLVRLSRVYKEVDDG